jgi:hypothetical protein
MTSRGEECTPCAKARRRERFLSQKEERRSVVFPKGGAYPRSGVGILPNFDARCFVPAPWALIVDSFFRQETRKS